MHLSAAQTTAVIKNLDAFAVAPVQGSFATNVNLVLTPLAELPSEAEIKAGLTRVGATVSSYAQVGTPVGRGIVIDFTETPGGQFVHAKGLFIDAPSGIVNVTATAVDQADVDTLYTSIIQTVHST